MSRPGPLNFGGLNRGELMIRFRDMVRSGQAFNHRQWSLTDAETFDQFAKLIRQGYERDDREWRRNNSAKND